VLAGKGFYKLTSVSAYHYWTDFAWLEILSSSCI
jgi:hypothetical protein